MKILNSIITFCILAVCMSTTSCQEGKYPQLDDGLYAEIITNKGTMVAKLYDEKTPLTVSSFIGLAEGTHPLLTDSLKGKPFYNGLTFHRVMNNFMIQGGDPEGTGRGGPGFKYPDEFVDSLKHDKPGILSMANSGANTNGSQFFITEKPTPWLDNRHTVFGELVVGLEVQDTISNVKVDKSSKPLSPVIIEQVNIIRNGFDAKRYDAAETWKNELQLLEQKLEEERVLAEERKAKAIEERLAIFKDYGAKASTTASGLKLHTISEGDGEKPAQGTTVMVYYEGYFTDGNLFGSNRIEIEEEYGVYNSIKDQRGYYKPAPMNTSADAQLIPGMKEGLATMKVGDKTFMYIPAHLAYGESGRGPIPPNADLIFIAEVVDIKK
jgi:peptidyl-prolyl cis-trans isomerase A (cyclophilin A)